MQPVATHHNWNILKYNVHLITTLPAETDNSSLKQAKMNGRINAWFGCCLKRLTVTGYRLYKKCSHN